MFVCLSAPWFLHPYNVIVLYNQVCPSALDRGASDADRDKHREDQQDKSLDKRLSQLPEKTNADLFHKSRR
jgi:hypothetical protein